MKEQRIAIIDCGTNTFHLLIADVERGRSSILLEEKVTVRIGQGGISFGQINEEAAGRAINALKEFSEKIAAWNVERTLAFATSAFRSAGNKKQLVDQIGRETGIHIQVIDGNREAELIYSGVQYALPDLNETSLVVDIGGGSVEFIIGRKDEILWKESFEIGGQRMIDLFYEEDPIPGSSVAELKEFLRIRLASLHTAIKSHQPVILVGSSGSFETLSDMYMKAEGIESTNEREMPLTIEAFHEILTKLITKPRSERLEIPGMIEMRVDMIVVASILIDYLLETFELKSIRVSNYALKEGVLSRMEQGKI